MAFKFWPRLAAVALSTVQLWTGWNCRAADALVAGTNRAAISAVELDQLRSYELTSNARLRDNQSADGRVEFQETPARPRVRTGNLMFDGLYALAESEASQNSVSEIRDSAYNHGQPIPLETFETGARWPYVWTRDLSYSTHLALANFDPVRAANSLLFKSSVLKPGIAGGLTNQIVQDTGSGGSYPVSSDRVVWALGAYEVLKYLPPTEREVWLTRFYPILRDTLEQDRRLVFDPRDGLYRGEQSFLDWREQTYPGWTKDNVLAIAESKALSVNAANYGALRIAAELAGRVGEHEKAEQFKKWAKQLKTAINRRFADQASGLYSTYLLAQDGSEINVHRYDCLGESLMVLLGVTDGPRADAVVQEYPVGPHGPPVVWPQERTVPIYHNHATWPFVTAYWTKAARLVDNAEAVDCGIEALMRGVAFNLSNMENFDFATGEAWARHGNIEGPVINSRRQIWSVAGYLSMVQDVVFGLETSWEGIRFRPYITGRSRREMFGSTNLIELENFSYQGRRITVRVHLPPPESGQAGACRAAGVRLNGKRIKEGFVRPEQLAANNEWDIELGPPDSAQGQLLKLVDVADERRIFGPLQPEWKGVGQGGITVEHGRLKLHFQEPGTAEVVFNIYCDGRLCAGITAQEWTDPESADYAEKSHSYVIEAVDAKTGNSSHLSPARRYVADGQMVIIPARKMKNRGGNLVGGDHFENWGAPSDELEAGDFTVPRSGRYELRAVFSNGNGLVNTGIGCGVKRVEVRSNASGRTADGYLVMPQSGDWKRFDVSSAVEMDLKAGEHYSIWLGEDAYSRNMSYLKRNEAYTALPGGGGQPCNYVNIAAMRLIRLRP